MVLRQIIDLPEEAIGEMKEYQRLFDIGLFKTITGTTIPFTSSTSGKTYDIVGTIYDNKGQRGMMDLLFHGDVSIPTNYKLIDYGVIGSDILDIDTSLTDVITSDTRVSNDFYGTIEQNTTLTYTGTSLTNILEYWDDGITIKNNITLVYTGTTLTSAITQRYSEVSALINTVTETLVYTGTTLTGVERTVT